MAARSLEETDMAQVSRISVAEAREEVRAGRALLVCAYEDDEKCSRIALEGSIPLSEFARRAPSLPREQEVIFFCA
jgi:hypothetical protein